jgi:hypothetical protein
LQKFVEDKKKALKDKTLLSNSTEKGIIDQANEYLKKQGLDKAWKVRCIKVNKTCTTV